jgi:hypothetical protein
MISIYLTHAQALQFLNNQDGGVIPVYEQIHAQLVIERVGPWHEPPDYALIRNGRVVWECFDGQLAAAVHEAVLQVERAFRVERIEWP